MWWCMIYGIDPTHIDCSVMKKKFIDKVRNAYENILWNIPPLYERKNEIQCATVYHVKLGIFYAHVTCGSTKNLDLEK